MLMQPLFQIGPLKITPVLILVLVLAYFLFFRKK